MLTEYTTPGASVEVRDDESIYSLLTERIKRTGEDTVIAERKTAPGQWTKVTTGEFHKNVLSAAKGLIAFGIGKGDAVTLFSGTPKGAAALTRDLADKGYSVSMSRDVRPAKGIVQVLPGHLTAGCTFPFAHAAVISSRRHGLDEEAAAENKKRKKNKNALSSLSDIKPGDYVVHQSHGIGMYAGIQRLEVQGATKDYLKVQYSGSDVYWSHATHAHAVQFASGRGSRNVPGTTPMPANRSLLMALHPFGRKFITSYCRAFCRRGQVLLLFLNSSVMHQTPDAPMMVYRMRLRIAPCPPNSHATMSNWNTPTSSQLIAPMMVSTRAMVSINMRFFSFPLRVMIQCMRWMRKIERGKICR